MMTINLYARIIRNRHMAYALLISAAMIAIAGCGGSGGGGDNSYLPAKPTGLEIADFNETSVSLKWTDNADNESGYVIERSVNGGEFIEIKKVGPDEKEYEENLPDDTVYTYRVCSYNEIGNSAYSNDAPIKRPKIARTEIGISTGGTVNLGTLAKMIFQANSFDNGETIVAIEGFKGESIADDKKPYLDAASDISYITVIDFTNKDLELKKSVKLVMSYDPAWIAQFNDIMQTKSTDLIAEGVITQDDVDKMKINVGEMDIYYFNTINNKWVKTNAVLDTNAHTFTVNTVCLGIYCIGYSLVSRRGFSIEADPEMQQYIIDVSNSSDENTENNARKSSERICSSCGVDGNSDSVSIARVYSGYKHCNRCPDRMIINGVEVDEIRGSIEDSSENVDLGCDNCSDKGAQADQLSGYAFTKACANHDCCYSHGHATYGYKKNECDYRFFDEMIGGCKNEYPLYTCWDPPFFPKICIPLPHNVFLRAYCVSLASVVYGVVATANKTKHYVIAYDLQPCYDYYKHGVDCNIPSLHNLNSSINRCEASEIITFTSSTYNNENRPLTYVWTATAGNINNPTAQNIIWTAPPSVAIDTDVTITLKISDGSNNIPAKSKTIKMLKNYTIAYNANDASSGTVPMATYHNYYGDIVTVPGNTGNLELAGYNFSGWNTRADGLGLDRPGGSFFIMGTSDLTLSAKWLKYPVVYNGNGNTGGLVPIDSTNYQLNDIVTVLGNTGNLVKYDYPFLGWNTIVDGSGDNYNPNNTFYLGTGNVILYAQWGWTDLLGVAGEVTEGWGIEVDARGNSYVVGNTTGQLDGQTIEGTQDAFIVKYNRSGVRQWTRLHGVSGKSTSGNAIAIDGNGNIYITGHTDGSLDGQTLTGGIDAFVTKYEPSGIRQWTKLIGVAGGLTISKRISVDTSGNVYLNGYTSGNLDGQTISGTQDMFVIKYSALGEKQWTKLLGATGKTTTGNGVTVDLSGNIYLSGSTEGNLDGQILAGTRDLFVAKYNIIGERQWTRLLGSAGKFTEGIGIAADEIGNCYIAGTTTGNIDGQILSGVYDACIIKYNTLGERQWTRLVGVSAKQTSGSGIAIDTYGYCYLMGSTTGNLGGQTLTGTTDLFITTFNTSGSQKMTKLIGVAGKVTNGTRISIDSSGNNYLTGYTEGNLDGHSITGTRDLFVTTKLNQK